MNLVGTGSDACPIFISKISKLKKIKENRRKQEIRADFINKFVLV